MRFTVLTTLLDERESIEELITRTESAMEAYQPYELLCVDDGSTDGTFESLLRRKETRPNLRVLRLEQNAGKSAALDAGFRSAQGEVIITIDGDLQNPPEEIPKLIDALEGHDAVFGWRSSRQTTLLRRWASRAANTIRRYALDDRSHDAACGLKAFRRHTLERLPMFRGMHRFFPALLRIHGYDFVEVKVDDCPRAYGESKYKNFGRGLPALFDLLAVRWMRKRRLNYRIRSID